ncbi:MAG: GGDEF domain-containing protein [Woeseiaceae bacterium]
MSPVEPYLLISLATISGMFTMVFYIIWKRLLRNGYALVWTIACAVVTVRWMIPLIPADAWSAELAELTVSFLALTAAGLSVTGYCMRSRSMAIARCCWVFSLLAFAAMVWFLFVQRHVGLSAALLPASVSILLFVISYVVLNRQTNKTAADYVTALFIALFAMTQMVAASISIGMGATGDFGAYALLLHFNSLTLPTGYAGIGVFVLFLLASDLSQKMRQMSIRDHLTGLLNRRGFHERASRVFNRMRRENRSISVIIADIDHFKQVNDQYGHAVGDKALVYVSEVLSSLSRPGDIVARFGGEEFVMLLPSTDLVRADHLAEQIRATLADTPYTGGGDVFSLTSSFGVASYSSEDENVSDMILRADRALYKSKASGRNRVDVESSQVFKRGDGAFQPIL